MSRTLSARLGGTVVAMAALSATLLASPATADPADGADKPASVAPAGEYCASGYHCLFFSGLGSPKKSYFTSDLNFVDDTFTNGGPVDNNSWSASNSSTGGYESHYYYGANYGGGLVFCVNPGGSVTSGELTDDWIKGNGVGQRSEASSLRLRPGTTISCFN